MCHTIADHVFRNCTNLKSIDLPGRLYSIGVQCFLSCSKLKFIKLPNTAHHVQKGVFIDCSNLISILYFRKIWNVYQICYLKTVLNWNIWIFQVVSKRYSMVHLEGVKVLKEYHFLILFQQYLKVVFSTAPVWRNLSRKYPQKYKNYTSQ